jgi:type IV secretion system protein VirD4
MNVADLILELGRWGQTHRTEMLTGIVAAPLLLGAASLALRHRRPVATTHGSARWATLREVKRAGLLQPEGVVLGRLRGRLVCDASDGHVLLCGPTRKKKGVSTIIPTLLNWLGSTIVLDPKDGENYDVTARWRAQVARNRIAYFTPCRMPHTCINVLDSIRLKTPQEFGDAYTIAQSLTAPEKLAKESATSLHFRELAAFLLTAAELHVCYSGGHASLAAVWAFLTQFHDSLHDCLQVMQTTAHTSHGVHQAITSLTSAIRNITGDRELGSVWSTAIRPLVLYNDPLVAASTDTSTFDLDALQYAPEPLSLYMVAPSPRALERLHPLYRVVLDVAMARLMDHKVRTWTHRLLLCADELPAHGYMHSLDRGAADMAGYGIKGLFVIQDIEQFEEVFGDKTPIWSNTDTKVFYAAQNDRTARRIAEQMLGEGTTSNPVEQHQGGLLGRRSTSYQHVGRALLTADEFMELDEDFEMIRRSGIKPMLANKTDYRIDPTFQRRVR